MLVRDAVGRGECATDVDGGVVGGDRLRAGVQVARKAGNQRAGCGGKGGDPVVGRAVDLGEVTDHVNRCAVGRGSDRETLGVQRVAERRDQLAGGDVVGEQVASRHGPGAADCDTCRARLGEAAGDVDGVTDRHLRPGHAVDLHGGQCVSTHGRRQTADRRGVCAGLLRDAQTWWQVPRAPARMPR